MGLNFQLLFKHLLSFYFGSSVVEHLLQAHRSAGSVPSLIPNHGLHKMYKIVPVNSLGLDSNGAGSMCRFLSYPHVSEIRNEKLWVIIITLHSRFVSVFQAVRVEHIPDSSSEHVCYTDGWPHCPAVHLLQEIWDQTCPGESVWRLEILILWYCCLCNNKLSHLNVLIIYQQFLKVVIRPDVEGLTFFLSVYL